MIELVTILPSRTTRRAHHSPWFAGLAALALYVYTYVGRLAVRRKLTITLADDVYRGLHHRVGRGQISRYIEDLVRPDVVMDDELEELYRQASEDREAEREAMEWIEADLGEETT